MTERPWSVSVRVDEVPESGRHVELEADAEARAALAKPAGVDAVERLVAAFDLSRRGEGLHVGGLVRATVRQACIVSLEPVVNEIEEAVDVDFAPAGAADAGDAEAGSADETEPLTGNSVDLGLLATSFSSSVSIPTRASRGLRSRRPLRTTRRTRWRGSRRGIKRALSRNNLLPLGPLCRDGEPLLSAPRGDPLLAQQDGCPRLWPKRSELRSTRWGATSGLRSWFPAPMSRSPVTPTRNSSSMAIRPRSRRSSSSGRG